MQYPDTSDGSAVPAPPTSSVTGDESSQVDRTSASVATLPGSGQWVHTEPDPRDGVWPLAPWSVHPVAPLDVDLTAELLSELRADVNNWTRLENEHVARDNRVMADWCGARVDTARDALRLAERLVARANRRAELRAARS